MISRYYIPQPPLSDFVEMLWYQEAYAPSHARERLLPMGQMELVINLLEDWNETYDHQDRLRIFRGSLIVGIHSEYFSLDTTRAVKVIGAHFKPGGAFPFLHLPAGELHNTNLSLEDLWGAAAGELRERLLEAETFDAKFHILEQALLARARQSMQHHPAVAFALRHFQRVPHTQTIADVTGQIGLSQRRFIELFSEQVGLTPKLFCRVRRFQEVVQLIHTGGNGRRVEWPAVALACGYYDQAHFIRDFQAFSGLNPSAYLTQRGEHLNHVPLPE